ncbi:MAG: hypothetical protein IKV27_05235 [Lachnospiraceae bacterium]|nr:hypothetical protein [Lachnospiraceae bacterium]
MRIGRKIAVSLCGILCLIMLLGGCGQSKVPSDLSVPAISVTGKGKVTAYIVEDFDKDYYDLAELRTMVEDELSKFNESRKGAEAEGAVAMVSLTETVVQEVPKAVLVLEFQDINCYREYFGKDLFYGTIAQAQKAGYDLNVEFTSVKDGTTIGKTEIFGMGNSRILIVQDKVRIFGPGKAQYVTSGAAVKEDGSVEPSDAKDNTYIIMK